MTFTTHQSDIREIRQEDPDFRMVDGFALVPRAMIHILPNCPANVRNQLLWAMDNGYVKCVANVRDNELMWDKLKHD